MPYFSSGELVSVQEMNVLASGGELDYQQITADVGSITAVTEGNAATVITCNSITYDGMRGKVECFVRRVDNTFHAVLTTFEPLRDAPVLGHLVTQSAASVNGFIPEVTGQMFDTP